MTLFYLDTEFIEDGKTIDLVSIGIVAEDGRELYLENSECDYSRASTWVMDNVLVPIGLNVISRDEHGVTWEFNAKNPRSRFSRFDISHKVFQFVSHEESEWRKGYNLGFEVSDTRPTIEVWGEWCSYDWVALCQLFGTMMDLPYGWPMRCRDVVQYCEDHLGLDTANWPASTETEGNHNALEGARTVKSRWEWCREQEDLSDRDKTLLAGGCIKQSIEPSAPFRKWFKGRSQ